MREKEKFIIVEKKNHLQVHGYFDSREIADGFLKETIPEYVARGYFTDKTLRADDFEVTTQENGGGR